MTSAAAWFLVFIGGQQWIGPLSEQGCKAAEIVLQHDGVVCRQPVMTMACPAPGYPEGSTFIACPVFDFPKVTVKP